MGVTGLFAINGMVTIGSAVAVTQLSGEVISPATELPSKRAQVRACHPILDLIDGLATAHRDGDGNDIVERKPVVRSLSLDSVYFSYAGAEEGVMQDCTARFEAGRKYAIAGDSGSGKSTVLGLLSKTLTPTSGTILTDDKKDAIPDAAFIHQNVFLFEDTLGANITPRGSFTDEQVMRAISLAGLEGVVSSLPQGLDTPVGEDGSRLSGGERQRVAIARALLYGKTTILADEATSALDGHMAEQVKDALLALDGVTVIEVTHHLSPQRERLYDGVLVMEDGRLRERVDATGRALRAGCGE